MYFCDQHIYILNSHHSSSMRTMKCNSRWEIISVLYEIFQIIFLVLFRFPLFFKKKNIKKDFLILKTSVHVILPFLKCIWIRKISIGSLLTTKSIDQYKTTLDSFDLYVHLLICPLHGNGATTKHTTEKHDEINTK